MKMSPEERDKDRAEQRKRRDLKAQGLCHWGIRARAKNEKWFDVPPCGAKVTVDRQGEYKCENGHVWSYL